MGLHILIVLLTSLASVVALPVTDGFRISLGVVVLFAMIHAFRVPRPILLAVVAGVFVSLTRILVDSFRMDMTAAIASGYFLEVFFYWAYGAIYYYAVRKNPSRYPLPFVVALSLGDMGANFIEYWLRNLAADETWLTTSLVSILLAAFVRSVLIVLLVWLLSRFVPQKYGIERSAHD